jgi:hypothetical protein
MGNILDYLLTLSFLNDRMINKLRRWFEIKTLTVRLDDELHRKFKIYSVNSGKDMQAILIEYIKGLVEENQVEKKQ